MKTKPPSVRVLIAALAAVLVMPVSAGAGASTKASTTSDASPASSEILKVSMTAYNAVPAQTDVTPYITASGAYSNPNVVAARSDDLAQALPFGTVIEIESASSSASCGYGAVGKDIGLRVIADAMNVKEKNKIDILMPQSQTSASGKKENPALVLGVCKNVTIKVVGHIDIASIPKTQSALAAAVDSSAELAVAN